ncbi:MAG: hypothetical protein RLZZ352_10 [Pseudomonadota bacterium]|jgi:DNA-binding NtrC family response regulator
MKRWLVTWVGQTDHDAVKADSKTGLGPVATALAQRSFDRVCLLTNYGLQVSTPYREWLIQRTNYDPERITLSAVELDNPINYALIYTRVCAYLSEAGLPSQEIGLTFHLSPGTSAMTAIWIMLAKTRFPAQLIQTSRERGLESVDFDFNLADDFLPEYLQRGSQRIERLANARPARPEFAKILHTHPLMRQQIDAAQRVAGFDVAVLILGESGTGKELFAEAIHQASSRKQQPFIAVNCGAMSPELASAELFGHEKGAFTGAVHTRKGYFRSAEGGTLFLDEVGDLPTETQVRLLRVLQEKAVTPVGATSSIKVNVRIVAATHRDLVADVASGRFREDLFHRLAVGILHLPPLRERAGDLDMLADSFLHQFNHDPDNPLQGEHKTLSPDARKVLAQHTWPGNVRELYHTVLRAAIWSRGAQITAEDMREALLPVMQSASHNVLEQPLTEGFSLPRLLDDVSRHYLHRALNQTRRRKDAAHLLGLKTQQTLTDWLVRLGIENKNQKNL